MPVFNGLSYTKKCLKALYEQKNICALKNQNNLVHIIIVDDGSSDGTTDWIITNYPEVHIVYGDGKLWWSGGINKGVAYALDNLKSDYILWWNNDIIPRNDYFLQLFDIIENYPKDVLIGSKIFVLNQDIIWGMGGKFDPYNGIKFMYGEQTPDNENFSKPLEVDWFPGMGTTIHRSVFEKIGFLDEINFPQYHGDSDFTFRAKKAGFRLMVFPELNIYNDNTNTGLIHQSSIRKLIHSLKSIKSNYNIRKDFLFYKKHSTSIMAYHVLLNKYFRYIGGFLKWQLFELFGIKKLSNEK